MATEQELIQALRRADAAGDAQAAQAIARRIQQQRQSLPESGSLVAAPRVVTNRRGSSAARTYSPVEGESTLDTALAGAGSAFSATGRGLKQAATQYLRDTSILPGQRAAFDQIMQAQQAEEAKIRQQDAPLLESRPGFWGNVGGNVATLVGPGVAAGGIRGAAQGANLARAAAGSPEIAGLNTLANTAHAAQTALLPATARAAALQGAAIGGLQPSTSATERAANAALGAGGAYLGARVGEGIASLARPSAPIIDAQRAKAVQTAQELGYVLPPGEIRPTGFTHFAEGLSGKAQIGQAASTKNQKITNTLVRRALGVSEDVPLTRDTLGAIRAQAGQSYEAIANVGPIQTDAAYKQALQAIAKKYDKAAQSFPSANRPTITNAVQGLDVPAFDAAGGVAQIRLLREYADQAFRSGDKGMGRAYREASEALESVIERNLAKTGQKDLLQGFRSARETIAKTYSVERALNEQTGDVSAQALAALLKKGKPLSGDLKKVAQVGQAFERSTQALKDPYRAFSPWDWLAAGGIGAGTGNPWLSASIAARPAVRSAFLSGPAQSAMVRKATTGRAFVPQLIHNTPQTQAALRLQRQLLGPTAGYGALLLDENEEGRY